MYVTRGHSSVGRASASQAEGRGFESRWPLQKITSVEAVCKDCFFKGMKSEMKTVKDGIYVKIGNTNVGVVETNEAVYIIDTGSSVKFAKELYDELEEVKKEKIVINTHSHADHIQGNNIFQKNGSRIFAHELEIPFIQHPMLESFYLYGATPPKSLKASFYKAKSSLAFPFEEFRAPENIKLIPLSGHSLGMTGLKVDDVIFCGDAYFGSQVLEKYSYPYLVDVKNFLESLKKLEKLDATVYIPSHGEISTHPMQDMNKTKKNLYLFIDAVLESVKELKSIEEISFELSEKMDVKLNEGTFYLFRSFISAIMSHLEKQNEIYQPLFGRWKKR